MSHEALEQGRLVADISASSESCMPEDKKRNSGQTSKTFHLPALLFQLRRKQTAKAISLKTHTQPGRAWTIQ